MRAPDAADKETTSTPPLLAEAKKLGDYLSTLDQETVQKIMKLSSKKARDTVELLGRWTTDKKLQHAAVDTFIGDIYSGLQAHTFSYEDRAYAHQTLYILSGLYGVVRALDGIYPYRLEMGYRFPDTSYKNLYEFWGDKIAKQLPEQTIINLSAIEYTKTVFPHLTSRIITPRFLTQKNTSTEPIFVVVHAKIARGAFARWLITERIESVLALRHFSDLGYQYDASLSTKDEPVFVCNNFQGLGLSVRLR